MGRGTPCPMPRGARPAIQQRVVELRASGMRELTDIAAGVQDIWPGATANHVRGVIAGMHAWTRAVTDKRAIEPWKPGMGRPEIKL